MSVLSGFVWSVADTLRGPYQEAEYGSVILPFTVLRRLECVMEPHRGVMAEIIRQYPGEQQRRTHLKRKTRTAEDTGLSFWTTSDYTLERALQDPENLADDLIDYVRGFSANLDVFKAFDFENVLRTLKPVVVSYRWCGTSRALTSVPRTYPTQTWGTYSRT